MAEGLHAYHPEGDHERDVARKIEERVIGAKDTPIRLNRTERSVMRRALDGPWLATEMRARELYNALARIDNVAGCDNIPFTG